VVGLVVVILAGATRDVEIRGVGLEHRASRHLPSGSLIQMPARSPSRAATTSTRSTASTRVRMGTMSRTSTAPMGCR
jgi:hypothetical protein